MASAASLLGELFRPFPLQVAEEMDGFGPLLRLTYPGTATRVLLLAHYDTVWPLGSWPILWSERDGKVEGPGIYDMKAGLLFIPWLLRYLEASGSDHPTLEILLNPDEEAGSPRSRRRIQDAARRSDFVLVLEPANRAGDLKLARKGSGEYVIRIVGRATHQGVEPENGINAVVEAAYQVLRLLELENPAAGTTIGPNVISGGSMSNTVPDAAELRVDVRAWTRKERQRIEAAMQELRPVLPGSRIQVSGDWNRPPMESTRAAEELFERARSLGEEIGLCLEWTAWGGSSDANLTAQVGTPTMDGLGPVGDGAHKLDEYIITADLPIRLALFCELVAALAPAAEEWLSEEALAQVRLHRESGNPF
jgi:glutamate carboxypeptidase